MQRCQRRSTMLLWGGALLFCLAFVSVALPGTGYAMTAGKAGFTLERAPQQVTLPAGQQYGIYVDDTDNSGYSEQCSINDADGQQIRTTPTDSR